MINNHIDFNKIVIILKYEFITGIRKKTFIFLSLFMPIFLGAILVSRTSTIKIIPKHQCFLVVDHSGFSDSVRSNSSLNFEYTSRDIEYGKSKLISDEYSGILVISENGDYIEGNIIVSNQVAVDHIYIRSELERIQTFRALQKEGIIINTSLKGGYDKIRIKVQNIDSEMNKDKSLASAFAFISALLLYLCIFQFSSMVMKNISMEKANRVVEILVSSTRTFELILGKILGVGLLGLVQFFIWIVVIITLGMTTTITSSINFDQINMMSSIAEININSYLIFFFLYFIGGYFLYASIYAALGAIVNQHTDSQQFVLPVVLPLLITFVYCSQFIGINNDIIRVLSYIPFTSPVAMLMRIPFKINYYEIIISLLFLYGVIFVVIYFTSQIFKEGILLFNSQITYRKLAIWLKIK